ncbi:MAG: deoxyribose-phosphate aldolase [Candidatus Buchananbacteria bacterium RIFCSPLOWO2_01_FULL_39_33]|uniref:Deoxyribose-phosphate aldolase n=1 Tax=Candidatus Buchananbacteria bacterium RIFCSPLOWO2_01_FULL_39_33 TaxID=1797543 RepID=A0A1G1YH22_9BACT|nr:MAG: deoxyribose-phosphate aldolase [Candidatus Buchananbacteria bacterium RIFCSPHIGHO2_01_FULL_40_35]OGY51663.1 MAG: deoxyribose-phosphate aldolase [Candidatus Buchananbacteria bacterium RIFCSPLOWO2_01_FULL_39_33]
MGIASYIDHTLLKPEATRQQIIQLCQEAREYGCAAVCVNPTWVALCKEVLASSVVKVCAVVGFPLGANLPQIKALEALLAVRDGADEVDMVANIGSLKSGDLDLFKIDIITVSVAIPKVTLKVIIETCLLTEEEKNIACAIANDVGADFVKTSTGFSTKGATTDDVKLMRLTVGDKIGVKASGGIKDLATAKAMLQAGANRLGCSNSVAIIEEEISSSSLPCSGD